MNSLMNDFSQFARNLLPGSIVLIALLLQLSETQFAIAKQSFPLNATSWLGLFIAAAYLCGRVVGWLSFAIAEQMLYLRLFSWDEKSGFHFADYTANKEHEFRKHLISQCSIGEYDEVINFFDREFGLRRLKYREIYTLLNFCKTALSISHPEVTARIDRRENKIQVALTCILPILILAISASSSSLLTPFAILRTGLWTLVVIWFVFLLRTYYDRIDEARVILWAYYSVYGLRKIGSKPRPSHNLFRLLRR